MLAQYLASLELLLPYDVGLVLPSHGARFEGHRAVITGIARHHDERCGVISGHVTRAPRTAHELVLEMWRRKLSPFHHHFAVFEILAHLEYMSRRGQLVSQPRPDGGLEWKPAL